MADARLKIILDAVDNASKTMDSFADNIMKHRKAIGLAMTAIGGGITAMAGIAVKSALDEEIGINRLKGALDRIGTSYDENRSTIEGVISALQKKTSFADDKQRQALESLITITGDYQASLAALPTVLDLATSLNMDLNSASLLVGKALAGETSSLSRYGIMLEEGATETEIIATLMEQFGGSAEAAANPMIQLKNQVSDLMEVIGTSLLPALKSVVGIIADVVKGIKDWTEAHPGLMKILVPAVAIFGGLLAVLGPLLIMLPSILAGIALIKAAMLILTATPAGAFILAIAAAIAVGVLLWENWDTITEAAKSLWRNVRFIFKNITDFIGDTIAGALEMGESLWKNWDTISEKARELWETISSVFKGGVNFMIGLVEAYANAWVKGVNVIIRALNSIQVKIPDWVPVIGGKGFGINLPILSEIDLPRLAEGGIVSRPTLAMLGERGPEMVTPLRGNHAIGGITLNFYGPIYGMEDFKDKVSAAVRDAARLGGFNGVFARGPF